MRFTEAFATLGYKIDAPRSDWSAESAEGVCITLWRKEMGFRDRLPWVDTKTHAQDNAQWRDKLGNKKRLRHLRRALSELDGFVDVVIVHGEPGQGFGDADPWMPDQRRGRWRVTSLDQDTGHFEAVVVPMPPPT